MKGCQVLVNLLDRKAKLLGMDAPVKVEAPPVVARSRRTASESARGSQNVDEIPYRSQGFPGQRPRLMITLGRERKFSPMTHTRATLLGRICTVVARARGGTTACDKAGEASRYVPAGFTFFLRRA